MPIMMCKSINCKKIADNKVFWPGKTTELCDTCTIRAVNVADAMGFTLDTQPLDMPSVEEIKEHLAKIGK